MPDRAAARISGLPNSSKFGAIILLLIDKEEAPISLIAVFIYGGFKNRFKIRVRASAINEALTVLQNFLNFRGKVIIITITIVP